MLATRCSGAEGKKGRVNVLLRPLVFNQVNGWQQAPAAKLGSLNEATVMAEARAIGWGHYVSLHLRPASALETAFLAMKRAAMIVQSAPGERQGRQNSCAP
jgi:hypothetical protein